MKSLVLRSINALLLMGIVSAGTAQAAVIGTFTGGDAGEGLDLDGNFLYAVNIGGNGNGAAAPDRQVRDAIFKDDFAGAQLIPGVTVVHSAINNWGPAPTYARSTNDNNLEEVMWDIGHADNAPRVQFDNLAQNTTYQFQILLSDNAASPSRRGSYLLYGGAQTADPFGDGRTILDSATDIDITSLVGNTATTGVVLTMVVNTGSFTTLSITSRNGTSGAGIDTNAIMNAVTVETIPEPSSIAIWSILGVVGFCCHCRWRYRRVKAG